MPAIIPSKFCYDAIKAIHRAETDAFAEMSESLGVIDNVREWPHASKRAGTRKSNIIFSKLWGWSWRRWGRGFF